MYVYIYISQVLSLEGNSWHEKPNALTDILPRPAPSYDFFTDPVERARFRRMEMEREAPCRQLQPEDVLYSKFRKELLWSFQV